MTKELKNFNKNKQKTKATSSTAKLPRRSNMGKKKPAKSVDSSSPELGRDPGIKNLLSPLLSPSRISLSDETWDIARLARTLDTYGKMDAGNDLFHWWKTNESSSDDSWRRLCYDRHDNFKEPPDALTWEEKAVQMFEQVDYNPLRLEKEVRRVFDIRSIPDEGTPQSEADWESRQFMIGLIGECPLRTMGYADPRDVSDHNEYWNKEDTYEPSLKVLHKPLALIWLIASDLLDHPWTELDDDGDPFTDVLEVRTALLNQQTTARKRKAARDATALKNSQPASQEKSSDMEVDVFEEESETVGYDSAASADKRSDGSTSASSDPAKKLFDEDDGTALVPRNITTAVTPDPSSKRPQSVKFNESFAKKQKTTKPRALPKKNPAAKNPNQAKANKTGPPLPKAPIPGTYSEAAYLPRSFRSDDEMISNLTQMNMEGMPFETVSIFNISIGVPWAGPQAESKGIQQKMLDAHVSALCEMFSSTDDKLTLLPLSDDAYKIRKRWISSANDVKTGISSWQVLKLYVDLYFDNGYNYLKRPLDVRDRTLRSRMRFGFDGPEDYMRGILNGLLGEFSGGCYKTPLQFGAVMKIGCLSHYPVETSMVQLSKQLMIPFDFKIPIATDLGWPASPWGTKRVFNYGSDPKLAHVFVRSVDAAKVDKDFTSRYSTGTGSSKKKSLKSEYPWGSPFDYIPLSKVNFTASEKVKSAIGRQLDRAASFVHISEVLECPISLPGMLSQVELTGYGKCTLLKILWAIKCTPEQADKAEKMASTNTATTAEDTISSLTTVGTAKQLQDRADGTRNNDPKALAAAVSVLLSQDEERLTPSPLFIEIVPSDASGCIWVFTVRKKLASLARRVLEELPAFLMFHLDEPNWKNEDKIFRKWMDVSAVKLSRKRQLVWNPVELRATSELEETAKMAFDDGLDFQNFLHFDHDPLESAFKGSLALDLNMSSITDIDDGATVANILAEATRLKEVGEELVEAQETILRMREEQVRRDELQVRAEAQKDARLRSLELQLAAATAAKSDYNTTKDQAMKESADSGASDSAARP